MKRLILTVALVGLVGCADKPVIDAGAPPSYDLEEDRAMRAALVDLVHIPPEVVARLRRLDTRIHCGEYVDDVRKVGFIVAKDGERYVLDAMGSPPKATIACRTYDDIVQEQNPRK
jgi:hypothetical protein